MENKGYQHPYGSTVVPSPPFKAGNGRGAAFDENNGPPGTPSVIPGAIGVAGMKATSEALKPSSSVAKLVDDFVEGLVEVISERVAERLVLILPTMLAEKRSAIVHRDIKPANMISPRPFDGALGNATIPMPVGPGLPQEQIEAYTKAHKELEDALWPLASVAVLRRAPEPPCWRVTARDGAQSEWAAYAKAYDNPRFPVRAHEGLYMVLVDGCALRVEHLPNGERNGSTRWQIGLTLAQILEYVSAYAASEPGAEENQTAG